MRLVVPFAAGGTTDLLARVVGQILAESTASNFIIDNRTGAGGNVSAEIVARATPDGMTLLLGTVGTAVTNQYLYRSLSYDSVGKLRARGAGRRSGERHGRASEFPGQDAPGVCWLLQGAGPQQRDLQFARSRQCRAPVDGISADRGRHQTGACRLSRQIGDDEGPDRGARPGCHGQPAALLAAPAIGRAQGAGRQLVQALVRRLPTCRL